MRGGVSIGRCMDAQSRIGRCDYVLPPSPRSFAATVQRPGAWNIDRWAATLASLVQGGHLILAASLAMFGLQKAWGTVAEATCQVRGWRYPQRGNAVELLVDLTGFECESRVPASKTQ
jgi:hypothetical protein